MGFADRTVADIAATLPGATDVFRRHRIEFCCGGQVPLATAAGAGSPELAAIEAELARLDAQGGASAPEPTDALIEHILRRFHDTHRRELPELIALAAKVEQRHAEHPQAPSGLHAALRELAVALDDHMTKEERILFPLMLQGGHPMIHAPIAQMQHEHDEHGARLARLAALTHDLALPADACASWSALYAGLRKLVDDIHEHVHLENNVLFPRFG
jgi:regulator of cell morphogenesis and NO signaling